MSTLKKITIVLVVGVIIGALFVAGSLYAKPARSRLPSPQNGSISISTPLPDSVVVGGQNLTVRIIPDAGTTLQKASAWFISESWLPQTVTNPPFDIQLQSPQNQVGPAVIQAVGIDGNGNSLKASVRVFVVAPSPPQSLSVVPKTLFFLNAGESSNISVSATFQDGLQRDVTLAPDTQYESTNPRVATVAADGTVQTIAPGVASINVSFTNLSQVIQVSVGVFEMRGDLDGNYAVDQNDIAILKAALNTSSTGPGDPRDLNGDGKIDSTDLQILTGLCTNQSCTVPGDTNVNIDVKPGSSSNPINLKTEGKIPVAILSTAYFDAPANIDRKSLTFGRTGNEISLAGCDSKSQDVNGDGLPDLVCHFTTQFTGFQVGDTVGILKGATLSLIPIMGKDSVKIGP